MPYVLVSSYSSFIVTLALEQFANFRDGGCVMVYHWGEWTMEESSPQNLNGQIGSTGGVNKQNENNNQRPQYSIPGILHFIQHEWTKFEMERSQWEVHKAELEVSFDAEWFAFAIFTLYYSHYSLVVLINPIVLL